jgi:xanthine dehydrogenase accessory factor
MLLTLLDKISALLETGENLCIVTVVASADPQVPPGLSAVVWGDGVLLPQPETEGFPAELLAEARQALRERKSRITEAAPGIKAFLDVPAASDKLLICGAGHIAQPLAQFALQVGFQVTVLDDRPDFASPARFPGCEVIAKDFLPVLESLPIEPGSYAVVITRGHAHDLECLLGILPRNTAYVGLIGSRRRVRIVLEQLREQGVPVARLSELFTPIGMPIGAESPEELALSIVAELVCVRKKGAKWARSLRSARGSGNE